MPDSPPCFCTKAEATAKYFSDGPNKASFPNEEYLAPQDSQQGIFSSGCASEPLKLSALLNQAQSHSFAQSKYFPILIHQELCHILPYLTSQKSFLSIYFPKYTGQAHSIFFIFSSAKPGCRDPVTGKSYCLPCTGRLQFIPEALLKHSSCYLIFPPVVARNS